VVNSSFAQPCLNLAFNNKFSLVTGKSVAGEVDLDYSRAQ